MPEFAVPMVGGGEAKIGGGGRWQMLVVYRGKHCPICKRYLGTLESLKYKYAEAGIEVLAVSADPREKAEPDVAEMKLTLPVTCAASACSRGTSCERDQSRVSRRREPWLGVVAGAALHLGCANGSP